MAYRVLTTAKKLESVLVGLNRPPHRTVNGPDCEQIIRSLSYLQSRSNKTWNEFIHRIQVFCEKPPKGFEKYYKPPGAAASAGQQQKGKVGESSSSGKDGTATEQQPSSSQSAGTQPDASSRKNDWNLGMFSPQPARGKGGSGGGGGSGRPIGGGEDGDKEKML
uniref:Uncharacterized protein n=1 Tax=Anopheles maculatus TaxID=74869 RepID=A0A182SJ27_9DIPT